MWGKFSSALEHVMLENNFKVMCVNQRLKYFITPKFVAQHPLQNVWLNVMRITY